MSAAQREESRRRIEAFKLNTEQKEPYYNNNLTERLAQLGDLESQAMLLANEDPDAAAELWKKAIERDGISNSCIPGAEAMISLWDKENELGKQIQELAKGEFNQLRRAISPEVRREVWRRDEGKCVKCGSRERLEYDHIIPFSKGGSNTARNIELLCESCNRSKSDSIQ